MNGTTITAMTYNVNHLYWNAKAVEEIVRDDLTDIFGLVEPSKEQASELKTLVQDIYPYYYRATGGGTSLFSQYPIKMASTENFGVLDHSLLADLDIGDKVLRIILTHPIVPISAEYFQRRNDLILALASYAQQHSDKPMIVMGDFNATSWSRYIRDFIQISGLKNSSFGHGIKPTWFYLIDNQKLSLVMRVKQIFKIPIDHIFVNKNISIEKVVTLASNASDHRPLVVELKF